jgi:hypothetical protein
MCLPGRVYRELIELERMDAEYAAREEAREARERQALLESQKTEVRHNARGAGEGGDDRPTTCIACGAAQMLELGDVIEREEREMRSCHGNREAAFELWYAQKCELLEQETQRLASATSSMAEATADEIAERYEAMALSIEERYTKLGAKIGAKYGAAMC